MDARFAFGLVMAATACASSWAGTNARTCDAQTKWTDYSSIDVAVQSDGQMQGDAISMKVELSVYDDGSRLSSPLRQTRHEVISVYRTDGVHTLASDPSAPRQLGEVGMVFEAPLTVLKQQFHDLCKMADKTTYPIHFPEGSGAIAGTLKRHGDAVYFVLREKRNTGLVSYVGSFGYHRPRGLLPTSLPIEGWTTFPLESSAPEDGKPVSFKTLGEFEASVEPTPAAK